MKESKLIGKLNETDKKINAISRVLQRLIQDVSKLETLANGTLSSLQMFLYESPCDCRDMILSLVSWLSNLPLPHF